MCSNLITHQCPYCDAVLCPDHAGTCCEGEDEEVDEEEEIEDEYTPIPMCEICHQNRGEDNSAFIFDEGDEVGVWICRECEEEALAEAYDAHDLHDSIQRDMGGRL